MINASGNDMASADVSRVAVKPPPFWKSNPALWFIQLESQFAIANIISDETKFHYVISALDTELLNSVTDLIMNPPKSEIYTALKTKLIEVHSESETSKIRTLLQGLELGDQRPSQLLTRMRSLAGDTVGETLLKSLWMNRLPNNMQSILAALNENLNGLASVADKIHELPLGPNVHAVNNNSAQNDDSRIARLEKKIEDLTSLVCELRTHNPRRNSRPRHRTNSFKRQKSNSRTRTSIDAENDLCFYHKTFGKNARKCRSPCKFTNQEN